MKFKDIIDLKDKENIFYNDNIYLFPETKCVSLEGSPREVNGFFNVSQNQLTSLKYRPEIIKGDFNCSHNNIESLEYAPTKVEGSYVLYKNNLKTLKGINSIKKS